MVICWSWLWQVQSQVICTNIHTVCIHVHIFVYNLSIIYKTYFLEVHNQILNVELWLFQRYLHSNHMMTVNIHFVRITGVFLEEPQRYQYWICCVYVDCRRNWVVCYIRRFIHVHHLYHCEQDFRTFLMKCTCVDCQSIICQLHLTVK